MMRRPDAAPLGAELCLLTVSGGWRIVWGWWFVNADEAWDFDYERSDDAQVYPDTALAAAALEVMKMELVQP